MGDYYIGLMSGTSLDGVDGVLVDFTGGRTRVVAAAAQPFAPSFRAELLALNSSGHDELHRAAWAGNQVAAVYAQVVHTLLLQAASQGIHAAHVRAVGAHGQTVRHQPQRRSLAPGDAGYTLQLNNPALLAELSGLSVVADFRSRDVAAGGQGAPLVPAFHQSVFGSACHNVAVLNVGGISNISLLPASERSAVLGFDCGPGNVLLDAWCQKHTGQPYDADGAWGASGQLLPPLLSRLLDEPYFAMPAPKSTGRDLFSLAWLAHMLAPFAGEKPEDVQCTLTELTAQACARALTAHDAWPQSLLVCGGGAFNGYLLQRLQAALPGVRVGTTQDQGLPPLQVEAAAFAWLARQCCQGLPGNLPAVTGAAGPRILGALYAA